jgi:hypothetical protein
MMSFCIESPGFQAIYAKLDRELLSARAYGELVMMRGRADRTKSATPGGEAY